MRLIKTVIVKIFFLAIIFSCSLIEINPKPNNMNDTPFAKKIKVTHKKHNDFREDKKKIKMQGLKIINKSI